MKQKDLVLVVVMVFIGAIVSLAISRVVFSPKQRQQTAEMVDVITPEFPEPPKKYFNIESVNPTQHAAADSETEDTEEDSADTGQGASQP